MGIFKGELPLKTCDEITSKFVGVIWGTIMGELRPPIIVTCDEKNIMTNYLTPTYIRRIIALYFFERYL